MQLSETTLKQLKFLSKINQSFWFRKDTHIQTITDAVLENDDATIIAQIRTERFPVSFGIYDLNQFLASIPDASADLTFTDKFVTIKSGNISVRYMFCNPDMLVMGPDEIPQIEKPIVEFDLEMDPYAKFLNLASTNGLTTLTFSGHGSVVEAKANDPNDKGSNQISLELRTDYDGEPFSVSFDIDHLKVAKDNYHCTLDENMVLFTSKTDNLSQYLMARKVE